MTSSKHPIQQYKYVTGLIGITLTGWLFYLLSPVLAPFLTSALLAYLCDPLADQLEERGLSRTLSVSLVFLAMVLTFTAVLLWVVPALEKEISKLISSLPSYIATIQAWVIPWVQDHFDITLERLDASQMISILKGHWQQAGGFATTVIASVSKSGVAIISWLVNLLIIPVVTFYLLRDWDLLVEKIGQLLPRGKAFVITRLAKESDQVLGAFLRGQFSVMVALGIIYSLGLIFMGLDYAILIGMLAGLVSFIPYLGSMVGLVAATLAAGVQFQDWTHVMIAAGIFGVGQLLEGFLLTPLLVGNKIGLHPVTVMFAIMAGGELFGFAGVLLALPVASVLKVLVRHAHNLYKASAFYGIEEETTEETTALSNSEKPE